MNNKNFEEYNKIGKLRESDAMGIMTEDALRSDSYDFQAMEGFFDFPKVDEKEIEAFMSEIWLDLSKEIKTTDSKLENVVKDEVNERLREYL